MEPMLRFRFVIAATTAALCFGLVSLGVSSQQTAKLSTKEVKALIANGKTAGDHEKLAAYYRDGAESLQAQQREHEEELQEYDRDPSRYPSKYPTMGDHCRGLAGYYGMAAQQALAMADMHEQMVNEVRSNRANPK